MTDPQVAALAALLHDWTCGTLRTDEWDVCVRDHRFEARHLAAAGVRVGDDELRDDELLKGYAALALAALQDLIEAALARPAATPAGTYWEVWDPETANLLADFTTESEAQAWVAEQGFLTGMEIVPHAVEPATPAGIDVEQGIVQRAHVPCCWCGHVPCCWCGEHHEEGR